MSFFPPQSSKPRSTRLKLAIGGLVLGTTLGASASALAQSEDYPSKPNSSCPGRRVAAAIP